MDHFDGAAFLGSLPWTVAAVVALIALTFATGLRAGRHNVIDVAWGLGFCVVALTAFVTSVGHGSNVRRVVLLVLVLVWGLRLALHIARRSLGKGEDPRYEELLGKGTGNRTLYALRMIYLLQGVLVLFIGLPLQVGMFEGGPFRFIGWLGVAAWVAGLFFEAVGDHQMSAFRADPANQGKLIDSGLWRYTRHPNYFGDACVWVGLFLIVAEVWPGVLSVLSPALMVYLLANGSGKKVLERSMKKRPGYSEYMRRTSGFLPLRRGADGRRPALVRCVPFNPVPNLRELPVTGLDGAPTTFGGLAGNRVALVVNVASRCGLTPQYSKLEQLQRELGDRRFTVVGFPCNQFGGQEPGTAGEIAEFCSATYGVTFPLSDKVDVNGPGRDPVYQTLTAKADGAGQAGDVQWNFEKFLVAPNGEVIARFRPRTEPDAPEVRAAIEAAIDGAADVGAADVG